MEGERRGRRARWLTAYANEASQAYPGGEKGGGKKLLRRSFGSKTQTRGEKEGGGLGTSG